MTDIVKVAIIAAVPGTITSLALIIPVFRRLKKVADGVDGINTALQLRADASDASKNAAQQELAHATGRREGVESVEDKSK